ncbi:hypothetical protein LSH36_54g02068 [Paralvinella palmiformis]|uniref:Uncharacterized protein n=1 Tax=Paralvinella palmiformis TaxID=53620 RepID=A0AAD9K6Z7_9ANNE|nr:hypothetical protein LSH36_54g02068 [Paralvinella palmiformis]
MLDEAPHLLLMQFVAANSSEHHSGHSECWSRVTCSERKRKLVCGSDGVTYTSRCQLSRIRTCTGNNVAVTSKGRCSRVGERANRKSSVCSPTDRKRFNRNMIGILKEEYDRSRNRFHVTSKKKYDITVIGWKFDELTTSSGGGGKVLKKRELANLKILIEKVVTPKKCAKQFDRYCDVNDDGDLSREEWFVCLGADIDDLRIRTKNTRHRRCNQNNREQFNDVIVHYFIHELDEVPPGFSGRDEFRLNPHQRAALRKFRSLDADDDGLLKRPEVGVFKSELRRKSLKLRRCTRKLFIYCDKNDNGAVDSSEWLVCFHLDTAHENYNDTERDYTLQIKLESSAPFELNVPKSPGKKSLFDIIHSAEFATSSSHDTLNIFQDIDTDDDNPDKTHIGCQRAREYFLGLDDKELAGNVFVPECEPTGLYRPEQCHTGKGICWCVDPDTGNPIPGTSTQNLKPNCADRDMERSTGCDYYKRKHFVEHMRTQFLAQWKAGGESIDEARQPTHNNVMSWKFRNLDVNDDLILEESELVHLKTGIDEIENLVECRKNLLIFCDVDNDSHVNADEWKSCMKNVTGGNRPQDDLSRNPFTDLLNFN